MSEARHSLSPVATVTMAVLLGMTIGLFTASMFDLVEQVQKNHNDDCEAASGDDEDGRGGGA